MAVDKQLGTEDNPDIMEQGQSVVVEQEPTRQELISDAAQILVSLTNRDRNHLKVVLVWFILY
jgi:hypothetical protein